MWRLGRPRVMWKLRRPWRTQRQGKQWVTWKTQRPWNKLKRRLLTKRKSLKASPPLLLPPCHQSPLTLPPSPLSIVHKHKPQTILTKRKQRKNNLEATRKLGRWWLNIQLTLCVFVCWRRAKALENHNLT